MAKNRHTFAKRQREMEKKRKAEEKRERRRSKGKEPAETEMTDQEPAAPETGGLQPTEL